MMVMGRRSRLCFHICEVFRKIEIFINHGFSKSSFFKKAVWRMGYLSAKNFTTIVILII